MMENQYEKGGRGARRPLCIKNEAKRKKNKRIKSNVCNTKFTNDVNSTCYLIFIQYLEKSYCYTNQDMKND